MAESIEYDFLYDLTRVDFCAQGLHIIPRIQYGREHPRQYMECIYRDGGSNRPVVVWIHGGAWSDENLTLSYRPERLLAELAHRGYYVACIEYRLAQHAAYPAAYHDCQAAVKYLRGHQKELGIDGNRIAVFGESAGAHLACLLGTNYNKEPKAQVQAVISWYAPSDLMEQAMAERNGQLHHMVEDFVGGEIEEKEALIREASPVSHISGKLPPCLLMHGEVDELVDCEQSKRLYRQMKETGCDAELILVPEQGHGFFAGTEYYDAVLQFLQRKINANA